MNLVAIQLNSGVQWELNRQQIVEQLAALPDERPCLVLLPENFACLGATADYQAVAETLGDGPIQRQLAAWARENEIWLVAGSLPTRVTGETRLHTSSLVYGPDGSLQGHYHKLHLFDVDVADGHGHYRESASFVPGEQWCVIDTPFGGLGLSICYDVRFPELYRQLRAAGASVLLVPAAFTHVTGEAHWLPLLRARAIENQCYVLAIGQGGLHENRRETHGNSMLIDPWGVVLTRRDKGEGVVIGDLDHARIAEVRASLPALKHRVM